MAESTAARAGVHSRICANCSALRDGRVVCGHDVYIVGASVEDQSRGLRGVAAKAEIRRRSGIPDRPQTPEGCIELVSPKLNLREIERRHQRQRAAAARQFTS